jgi:hypothetical protein
MKLVLFALLVHLASARGLRGKASKGLTDTSIDVAMGYTRVLSVSSTANEEEYRGPLPKTFLSGLVTFFDIGDNFFVPLCIYNLRSIRQFAKRRDVQSLEIADGVDQFLMIFLQFLVCGVMLGGEVGGVGSVISPVSEIISKVTIYFMLQKATSDRASDTSYGKTADETQELFCSRYWPYLAIFFVCIPLQYAFEKDLNGDCALPGYLICKIVACGYIAYQAASELDSGSSAGRELGPGVSRSLSDDGLELGPGVDNPIAEV